MSPKPLTRLLLIPLVLALVPTGRADAQNSKAKELKTLKALLVLDTSDRDLAAGVRKDHRNLTSILVNSIPKDRLEITELAGNSITAEQVLTHYKNLKVGPDDALLFYYSGHGSIRTGKGHTLELQKGTSPLYRTELVSAMTARKAALTVLMTDCCSNRFALTDANSVEGKSQVVKPPATLAPLTRKLFFQTRGLVDITAATNDIAWGDDFLGGYFTNAVCRTALRSKDKELSWKEFHASVGKETIAIHVDSIRRGIAERPDKGQYYQTPAALKIAVEPLEAEVAVKAAPAKVAAIVSLTNPGKTNLEFEYRWVASQPWLKRTIPANGRMALGTWFTPDAKTPGLLVRLGGEEFTLVSRRYDKPEPPKFSDGELHTLAPKKPEQKPPLKAKPRP